MSKKAIAAAQLRANITAYLNQRSGEQFTVAEIAEGLGTNVNAVGRMAKKMAEDGLIFHAGQFRGKAIYMSAESPLEVRPSKKVGAAKEVELVIGGMLVVVGRNEKTGRVRVTLEELS